MYSFTKLKSRSLENSSILKFSYKIFVSNNLTKSKRQEKEKENRNKKKENKGWAIKNREISTCLIIVSSYVQFVKRLAKTKNKRLRVMYYVNTYVM